MQEGIKRAMEEAAKEKAFSAEELLNQILPLINEYFIGEFGFENGNILCKFPNGQLFHIYAEEVG